MKSMHVLAQSESDTDLRARSSAGEHLDHTQGVACSIHAAPTKPPVEYVPGVPVPRGRRFKYARSPKPAPPLPHRNFAADFQVACDFWADWGLSAADVIGRARPVNGIVSGVYFLIRDGEIVYVGQAIDIASRVYAHSRGLIRKHFDAYYGAPCAPEYRDVIEAAYILKFRPEYNGNGGLMRPSFPHPSPATPGET